MTTSLPVEHGAEPAGTEENYLTCARGLKSWIFTLDHKRIGVMYLIFTMGSFLLGGIFSLLLLAIAIIDDKEHAEKRRQEKRDRFTKSQRNPLAGPKPF